jgi:hypothetical protein
MPNVSIVIQPDILARFSDLNFKPSQAIAEFIDNAIQSYLDHQNNSMFYKKGYKLVVDVEIGWGLTTNNKTYAKSITITDNAAGISKSKFDCAFETGHKPDFNQGLNEYGMGMKVAAFWLCKKWTTVSKNFAEQKERSLVLDLDDIIEHKHQSLEYTEKDVMGTSSYTIVRLENLNSKNNFTKAKLGSIKEELASIYRTFIRRGEIQINVNGEALQFEDPQILIAPYFDEPNGKPIEWKTSISCSMFNKEINGFIGILSEMSEKKSGIVIIRRGRVIVGESSDHLYHPESLVGTYKNGFLYKRLYGEIEIKGFSASFNKNGFSNLDELEEMLKMLKSTLKVDGHSIIKQAENLRVKPPKPTAQYSVKWILDNGEPDIIQTYSAGASLSIPLMPHKVNYSFGGWMPAPQKTVNSNITYTAIWRKDNTAVPEYQIRWVFGNGNQDLVTKCKKGERILIPHIPSREGYSFIKWMPKPNEFAVSDSEYIAQWEKIVKPSPDEGIVASKYFVYKGVQVRMNLVKDDRLNTAMALDMSKYSSSYIVECKLNMSLLPVIDKSLNNADVKSLLLSIAIAYFEAQMNNEDSCEGLIKHIK